MRLSRYFLPVLKENPAEAQIVSHRYMLRAGMIKQQAAGIYSWLPLGYRVLRRIEEIVHQEQIRAGHIPLLMPTMVRRCCGSPTARSASFSMAPRTRR
jgi:prolyl-tRNA synthetase